MIWGGQRKGDRLGHVERRVGRAHGQHRHAVHVVRDASVVSMDVA